MKTSQKSPLIVYIPAVRDWKSQKVPNGWLSLHDPRFSYLSPFSHFFPLFPRGRRSLFFFICFCSTRRLFVKCQAVLIRGYDDLFLFFNCGMNIVLIPTLKKYIYTLKKSKFKNHKNLAGFLVKIL